MTTETMKMLTLKRSYELIWSHDGKWAELRDGASNNAVVYRGTYRQCVREAMRRGLWHA